MTAGRCERPTLTRAIGFCCSSCSCYVTSALSPLMDFWGRIDFSLIWPKKWEIFLSPPPLHNSVFKCTPGQKSESVLPKAVGKEEVENSDSETKGGFLPLPGRKPCTTPAQQCSDERPQVHLQQSIASFPCLVHNVDAQTDAQTPSHVHPASPHPCAHTHFQSGHLFCPTCASLKGWCTDPAPLMLSQAKSTPNAKSLPVRWGAFMSGWPVGQLSPIIRREARGEGVGVMGFSVVFVFSIPQLVLQLLIQRGSRRFLVGPIKHLPAPGGCPRYLEAAQMAHHAPCF